VTDRRGLQPLKKQFTVDQKSSSLLHLLHNMECVPEMHSAPANREVLITMKTADYHL